MSSLRTVKQGIVSLGYILLVTSVVCAQNMGGIRGSVYDKDFEDYPLPGVQVLISETGATTTTTEDGNYVFGEVKPGTYTLIFAKEGFTRQFTSNVVVVEGRLTEVNVSMPGEFTEMEEFVVQDLEIGGGSEAGLLAMRMKMPALVDSVGQEQMSRGGASDAGEALKLVSGATVSGGKYAVVRGLPDRYVSSQLNGVRLPTADSDKRAVELDQFPAAVIESVQVSKTFIPNQQGDASGGAVNLVTKGIPEETTFNISAQLGYNNQVTGRDDFLSYDGGGVTALGFDDGSRDIQWDRLGQNWDGAVGVNRSQAPVDYKLTMSGGGRKEYDTGITFGGFGSLFYERDSSFYDDGVSDQYWVENPGDPLSPQYTQGTPQQEDFATKLFDVTRGSQEVKWGTLGTLGMETENNKVALLYMYTRVAEDVATLTEDTRGKHGLHQYWPGTYGPEYDNYDRSDPCHPGNQARDAAPYLRNETLQYTERTTQTMQLSGDHTLVWIPEFGAESFRFSQPKLDWGAAVSSAGMNQPDKRQFASAWYGPQYTAGFPPYVPAGTDPAYHSEFKPAANFSMGNLQRIWKKIDETSIQGRSNVTMPFTQWNEEEGNIQFGLFDDNVEREYQQQSFSNFNDNGNQYFADWPEYWSRAFPNENHPVTEALVDVDYDAKQRITAAYGSIDLPLNSKFKMVGGARWERTELNITNYPEADAQWIPPGTSIPTNLNPGDADVDYRQRDLLPSVGLDYKPLDSLTLRGAYSQTVARQTFKELTPIQQMEFLGGDVFVGNPELTMSSLDNYDLRADYTPYAGGLLSLSWFYKDIKDPIEYVQRLSDFVYTTAVNYPEGRLTGWEFEVRQRLGEFWETFEGLGVGANVTLIDSEVTLPQDEQDKLNAPNIQQPMTSRDMTQAPEHLYNIFMTHDIEHWGMKFGLFYTVKGDTLVSGAGQSNGKYLPNVYAKEYGTLNATISKKFENNLRLKFQAKNLLNPKIQEVYRYDQGDRVKTSYRRGIELSLSLAWGF